MKAWLRGLVLRLIALFRKEGLEQDLDEELRSHLEMQIQENVRKGMSPQEARYAALRSFGGVEQVKEIYREQRSLPMIETIVQDLSYGLRMMLKNRGFSVTALVSLGLGIGCTVTVFTFVDAVLIRKLPVRSPEQLVAIGAPGKDLNLNPSYLSHALYQHLRDSHPLFLELIASSIAVSSGVNLRLGEMTERVRVELVSGNYFELLGVSAAIGRVFSQKDDERPGAHPVVVLSHMFWQRRFGGATEVVGQTMTFNGHPFTVIGVACDGFFGTRPGFGPDFWVPLMMVKQINGGISPNQRDQNYLEFMGRLRPAIKLQEAEAAVAVAYQRWLDAETQKPGFNTQTRDKLKLRLTPVPRGLSLLRGQYSLPLIILMAAVSLLFIISCANVAILFLARSTIRAKEFGLRLSLGAGRGRLVRQLITESLLLSLLGGGLGLAVSAFLGRMLITFLPSNAAAWQFAPDARVFLFAYIVSVLTGLFFGLAPALAFTRTDLVHALKGQITPGGVRILDLRGALSVFQVALSVILVIGAGLFLRTLDNLKSVDLGFQRENLLLISFDPARSGYERVRVGSFFDQLLQRIREQPGVKAASLASHGSLSGVLPIGTRFINTTMHAEGSEPKPGEDSIYYKNFVAPSYFDTVGTRLVRGRDFNPHDYRDNPRAAIVNETAARDLFKGADPIGKRIGHGQSGPADIEIVGVVKDAKYLSVREAPLRILYFPFHGSSPMTLHVRTSTDAKMMIPIIRRETHALDPNVPLFHIQTMTTRIDDSLREERLVFMLGSTLGVLGTLLAAVGLYGVLSYSVIQRSREIGIRMALGAQRADVLGMALRQGMKLACVGIVIGMMGAVGLTVLLRNMLFGVSPTDPLTFAVVSLLLAGVALLASWLPARRAAKVDPIVALRYE